MAFKYVEKFKSFEPFSLKNANAHCLSYNIIYHFLKKLISCKS